MGSNLGIRFPSEFTSALASLNIINIDIFPSLNLSCMYEVNYITQIYATTLAPIGVSVLIFLGMLVTHRGAVKKAASASANPILVITYLVFISTSSALFGFFKCDKVRH